MYLVQYEDLPFFFLGGGGGGGGVGWVNLQYISILSRARSRNFLSQGMLQKHGFFFSEIRSQARM